MKRKERANRFIAFFLPGFLWMSIVVLMGFIRSSPSAARMTLRQTRGHPVVFGIIGLSFAAGMALTLWGMGHRTTIFSNDVAMYNKEVSSSYIFRVETGTSAYCYAEDTHWGGYYCSTKEETAKIVLDQRMRNLEQKDKFAKLAQGVKDPRISSRALYNMGTTYLRDAVDFKDGQSLEDAILALQNSLRDDSSYRDSFDAGSMILAQNKRINLEIALRIQDAFARGAGDGDEDEGEGEGDEEGDGGSFGAGKSDSDRQP